MLVILLYCSYYGGTLSEKVLGKALKTLMVPRDQYVVSTKCGRYAEGFDFSAERVTQSIDESLARLNLDYVDILQCHDIEFRSLDQVFRIIHHFSDSIFFGNFPTNSFFVSMLDHIGMHIFVFLFIVYILGILVYMISIKTQPRI